MFLKQKNYDHDAATFTLRKYSSRFKKFYTIWDDCKFNVRFKPVITESAITASEITVLGPVAYEKSKSLSTANANLFLDRLVPKFLLTISDTEEK